MKLPIAILLLTLSNSITTNALKSNLEESPQILSDNTDVCKAQGRTSTCQVELDVPAACVTNAASNCPIVFFFHGAGGTNDWFARTAGVHSANVIGVYPQGEDGWNTGPKKSNFCSWDDYSCTDDPDEGAFIASIISEVRTLGANGNIYLIGNSNGAALSMRLASNAGEDDLPIKGMVTKVTQLLASPPRSGPGELNYNQPGSGGSKVSILNIMGTADMVIPYEGGSSSVFSDDDSFQLMSALESMATWAAHNGCGGDGSPPVVTDGISYSNNMDPNGDATLYEYQGCPEGVIVEHYALHGAGHSFGSGAALDGVAIDYDFAYQFINRLEESDGGGGGGGGSGPCEDDPDWHGKFNEAHTCTYIGEAPTTRCGYESTDGTLASLACKEACGECGGVDPDPTPAPSPSPVQNTPSPVQTAACQDDPDWHGAYNTDHNCAYVSESPSSRCGWQNSDGTAASVACKKSCDECDGGGPDPTPAPTPSPVQSSDCSDDPNWHGKFNEAHNCAYISEASTSRCGYESTDGTLASIACKESCGEC